MAKVLRLRSRKELFLFEALLCGDDPVRLTLGDGTCAIGMALDGSDGVVTLLDANGVQRRHRYAEIVAADPLDPGPEFDAVVDALVREGFIAPPDLHVVTSSPEE